eukprot:gene10398-12297_t
MAESKLTLRTRNLPCIKSAVYAYVIEGTRLLDDLRHLKNTRAKQRPAANNPLLRAYTKSKPNKLAAKDASCTVEATDADVATVRPGLFSNFEFNANSPAIEREPEQTENGSSDAAADEPMVDAGGSPSRDE